MSKLRFYIAFCLALLFVMTTATTPKARNYPREVDHQTQYGHPWGGDENVGGGTNITATSVQPNGNTPYRYVDGTKTGIVLGAFQFIWDNIDVLLTSYTRGDISGGKTARGSSVTSASFTSTGSNSATPAGSGGKGGQ